MNLKDILNKFFSYSPPLEYNFTLPDNSNKEELKKDTKNEKVKSDEKIFPSISVNKEYMQVKYNTLINSDIVLREFTLNARGRQYNAFIIYIDGMIDSKIMDDFILKPLMLRNRNNLFDGPQNRVVSEAITNNITIDERIINCLHKF